MLNHSAKNCVGAQLQAGCLPLPMGTQISWCPLFSNDRDTVDCAACSAEISGILAEDCPRRPMVAPSIVWALRIALAAFVIAAVVAAKAWLS